MAALNRMDPASSRYWLSQHHMEQQQTLPSLSIQQRFISAATEFTSPTDTANSNANSSNPNHGHRNDTQQFEQQFLPGLCINDVTASVPVCVLSVFSIPSMQYYNCISISFNFNKNEDVSGW
jgi:hypothetical protein